MTEQAWPQWWEEGEGSRLPPLGRFDYDKNEHSSIDSGNHCCYCSGGRCWRNRRPAATPRHRQGDQAHGPRPTAESVSDGYAWHAPSLTGTARPRRTSTPTAEHQRTQRRSMSNVTSRCCQRNTKHKRELE